MSRNFSISTSVVSSVVLSIRRNSNVLRCRGVGSNGVVIVGNRLAGRHLPLDSDERGNEEPCEEKKYSASAGGVADGRVGADVVAAGVEGTEGAGPADEEHELDDAASNVDDHGNLGAVEDGREEDAADEDAAHEGPGEDGHDAEGRATVDGGSDGGAEVGVVARVGVAELEETRSGAGDFGERGSKSGNDEDPSEDGDGSDDEKFKIVAEKFHDFFFF